MQALHLSTTALRGLWRPSQKAKYDNERVFIFVSVFASVFVSVVCVRFKDAKVSKWNWQKQGCISV